MRNIILTVLLAVAFSAHAEWDPIKHSDDGSVYTGTPILNSTQGDEGVFSVYMHPSADCKPIINVLNVYDEPAPQVGEVELSLRYRVDQQAIHNLSATLTVLNDTDENNKVFGVYRISHYITAQMMKDILKGQRMIMAVGDSKKTPNQYSLEGSRDAILKLFDVCNSQMGDGFEEPAGDGEWVL